MWNKSHMQKAGCVFCSLFIGIWKNISAYIRAPLKNNTPMQPVELNHNSVWFFNPPLPSVNNTELVFYAPKKDLFPFYKTFKS